MSLREIVCEGVDLSGPGYGPAAVSRKPRNEPLSYRGQKCVHGILSQFLPSPFVHF